MCAIFVLRSGELIEMMERPYDAESDLQSHLEAHPELLSAEVPESERRRWLLVRREMGVADREEAPDRWSLDHLFVDQDAIPTFVEVKRSKNTDIRRKVVGQMLDYAANASAYWDAGRLRSSFESRFDDAKNADDEFSKFIEGDLEPEEFWDAVATNLQERRLRLVFVADDIPAELRSIVEFLNEQLELTEVVAVEVKQYLEPNGDRINIVPRIIGDTEMARRVKRPGGGERRPPNLSYEELMQRAEDAGVDELYKHAVAAFEAVLHKQRTRNSIAFAGFFDDGSRQVVISFLPGDSNAEVGLRYQLYKHRFAELAKRPIDDVESLMPQQRDDWFYGGSDDAHWRGCEGFITREEIDRLAGTLRQVADPELTGS